MTDVLKLVSGGDMKTSNTLSKLSDNDIENIWADVSVYIERQMTVQKGVHLSGLGTFTFSQQRLDVGSRFLVLQRPVFLLSGRLQAQGLSQSRPLAAATFIPVVQLNFSAVSHESPFSRDVVEGCVRETLLLLFRALASEQHLLLTFPGVGVLSFKNKKVRMKFNRDFVNAMDGSGRLLLAFSRSGSSASLMSSGSSRPLRPHTAHPPTLPAVCSPLPGCRDQRHAGDAQQQEAPSHHTLQPAKMKAPAPTEATDKITTDISPPEGAHRQEEPHVTDRCSGHTRAGQELCYLCMQREQNNVPVYLHEDRQAEEHAQEKLLLLKEQLRDRRDMEQQQEKMSEQREHARLVAKFNQEMSQRKQKTCCPLYPTSFVFPDRLLTPARGMEQRRYRSELETQVERKRQQEARDRQRRLLLEHLGRVQLEQDLDVQRAQQVQQKKERTRQYRRALDTQVEDRKGAGLPERLPDTSGFARCETAESDTEGRQRAHKVSHENFSVAAQRTQDKVNNRQAQAERERETLQHSRRELILDRLNRFERKWDVRKTLEDDWCRSAKLKHQREEEERHFLRSAGQLLVDKLSQHRRCHQCKRRTTNRGESNIWRDSQHAAGSQFMI
ncbi:coiled-coil domain-containing protein 81-like [Genypterus blacodes]|uniref:coiled-coil domain-containing protein 81-like n=1 Tax=Genypterus blacodes TaxID=154954 RepID=UPI003F75A50B